MIQGKKKKKKKKEIAKITNIQIGQAPKLSRVSKTQVQFWQFISILV